MNYLEEESMERISITNLVSFHSRSIVSIARWCIALGNSVPQLMYGADRLLTK